MNVRSYLFQIPPNRLLWLNKPDDVFHEYNDLERQFEEESIRSNDEVLTKSREEFINNTRFLRIPPTDHTPAQLVPLRYVQQFRIYRAFRNMQISQREWTNGHNRELGYVHTYRQDIGLNRLAGKSTNGEPIFASTTAHRPLQNNRQYHDDQIKERIKTELDFRKVLLEFPIDQQVILNNWFNALARNFNYNGSVVGGGVDPEFDEKYNADLIGLIGDPKYVADEELLMRNNINILENLEKMDEFRKQAEQNMKYAPAKPRTPTAAETLEGMLKSTELKYNSIILPPRYNQHTINYSSVFKAYKEKAHAEKAVQMSKPGHTVKDSQQTNLKHPFGGMFVSGFKGKVESGTVKGSDFDPKVKKTKKNKKKGQKGIDDDDNDKDKKIDAMKEFLEIAKTEGYTYDRWERLLLRAKIKIDQARAKVHLQQDKTFFFSHYFPLVVTHMVDVARKHQGLGDIIIPFDNQGPGLSYEQLNHITQPIGDLLKYKYRNVMHHKYLNYIIQEFFIRSYYRRKEMAVRYRKQRRKMLRVGLTGWLGPYLIRIMDEKETYVNQMYNNGIPLEENNLQKLNAEYQRARQERVEELREFNNSPDARRGINITQRFNILQCWLLSENFPWINPRFLHAFTQMGFWSNMNEGRKFHRNVFFGVAGTPKRGIEMLFDIRNTLNEFLDTLLGGTTADYMHSKFPYHKDYNNPFNTQLLFRDYRALSTNLTELEHDYRYNFINTINVMKPNNLSLLKGNNIADRLWFDKSREINQEDFYDTSGDLTYDRLKRQKIIIKNMMRNFQFLMNLNSSLPPDRQIDWDPRFLLPNYQQLKQRKEEFISSGMNALNHFPDEVLNNRQARLSIFKVFNPYGDVSRGKKGIDFENPSVDDLPSRNNPINSNPESMDNLDRDLSFFEKLFVKYHTDNQKEYNQKCLDMIRDINSGDVDKLVGANHPNFEDDGDNNIPVHTSVDEAAEFDLFSFMNQNAPYYADAYRSVMLSKEQPTYKWYKRGPLDKLTHDDVVLDIGQTDHASFHLPRSNDSDSQAKSDIQAENDPVVDLSVFLDPSVVGLVDTRQQQPEWMQDGYTNESTRPRHAKPSMGDIINATMAVLQNDVESYDPTIPPNEFMIKVDHALTQNGTLCTKPFDPALARCGVMMFFNTWNIDPNSPDLAAIRNHIFKFKIRYPNVQFMQITSDNRSKAKNFVRKYLQLIPSAVCHTQQVWLQTWYDAFDVADLPHAFVIDDGYVTFSGHPRLHFPQFQAAIRQAHQRHEGLTQHTIQTPLTIANNTEQAMTEFIMAQNIVRTRLENWTPHGSTFTRFFNQAENHVINDILNDHSNYLDKKLPYIPISDLYDRLNDTVHNVKLDNKRNKQKGFWDMRNKIGPDELALEKAIDSVLPPALLREDFPQLEVPIPIPLDEYPDYPLTHIKDVDHEISRSLAKIRKEKRRKLMEKLDKRALKRMHKLMNVDNDVDLNANKYKTIFDRELNTQMYENLVNDYIQRKDMSTTHGEFQAEGPFQQNQPFSGGVSTLFSIMQRELDDKESSVKLKLYYEKAENPNHGHGTEKRHAWEFSHKEHY